MTDWTNPLYVVAFQDSACSGSLRPARSRLGQAGAGHPSDHHERLGGSHPGHGRSDEAAENYRRIIDGTLVGDEEVIPEVRADM